MQPAHASFAPDLDLNPPVGWSKPARALGLSNPLQHLPQSQQVQRLQQQIQQHRQLQQSALQGHDKSRKGSGTGSRMSSKSPSNTQSLFNSNPTSSVSDQPEDRYSKTGGNTNHRHSMHFGATASEFGYVQHINIQNHNDEDSNMSGDDHDEDGDDGGNCTDSSANSIRGGMDIKTGPGYSNQSYHHYRSPTNTAHFSRGFTALHGFTPIISPGSNNSPPFSPGSESFTSDSGSAFGSSFPLQHPSGNSYSNSNSNNYNNNSGNSHNVALDSSLSSLAALSVMADPLFRRSLSSGNTSQPPQNTLSGMYQDQHQKSFELGSRGSSNSIDSMQTFTSALGQQLQREQQQQQQQQHHQQQQEQQQQQQQHHGVSAYQQQASSVPTMSVSLPAPSTFEQYREQQQQQQQQQQDSESASSMSSRRQSQPLIPPRRHNVPARQPQATAPRKYHGRQTRQVPIVTNVVKEVVTPTRRMAHILSEQKRREKINGGFDELKSVIPECADNTDSKASILRKAVDYICLLEDEIRKYVEVYEPDHGGDFGDQRRSED